MPVARRAGIVVRKIEGEMLIYDTERHQAHCLNENAALIWENCDGKRSISELSELLRIKIDPTLAKSDREELVWIALSQLEESRLLESPMIRLEQKPGLTRRQLMKAAGIAALIAVPVVNTIVAPTTAQASTCLASGQGCTISAQCCSGLCSVGTCV